MYKSSKQRDLIMNYMKQIDGHVSAEKIFQDLNGEGTKISLATVYRNLNILCDMHEIKKIAHPIEGYQYDKTCKPHYHLHCIKCDRILDLDIPYNEEFNKEMSEMTGLPIKTHDMMVDGICKECLEKQRLDDTDLLG